MNTTSIKSMCLTIGSAYLLWIAVSSIIFNIGLVFQITPNGRMVLFYMSVLFFLILAFYITITIIFRLEPYFKKDPLKRLVFLSFHVLIFIVILIWVNYTHSKAPLIFFVSTANLIIFSSVLGPWITTPVNRLAELIPVCVAASMADIFSVLKGPTNAMIKEIESYYSGGMQGAPPWSDFLLMKFAIPGYKIPAPIFGVADWIIIAFLVSISLKFNVNDNILGKSLIDMSSKSRPAIYFSVAGIGLVITIFVADSMGIYLPALPLISSIFVGFIFWKVPAARDLQKQEWQLTFGVVLLMSILFFIFTLPDL